MLWCGFCKEIETKYTKETILKIIAQKNWCSILPNLKCIDPERLLFRILRNKTLVTNSFQPTFRLDVQSRGTFAKIYVKVSAELPTKVLLAIYSAACTICQLALLGMWFRGELDFSFVLLIPFFLFIGVHFLTHFALRFSARPFIKELRDTLS